MYPWSAVAVGELIPGPQGQDKGNVSLVFCGNTRGMCTWSLVVVEHSGSKDERIPGVRGKCIPGLQWQYCRKYPWSTRGTYPWSSVAVQEKVSLVYEGNISLVFSGNTGQLSMVFSANIGVKYPWSNSRHSILPFWAALSVYPSRLHQQSMPPPSPLPSSYHFRALSTSFRCVRSEFTQTQYSTISVCWRSGYKFFLWPTFWVQGRGEGEGILHKHSGRRR